MSVSTLVAFSLQHTTVVVSSRLVFLLFVCLQENAREVMFSFGEYKDVYRRDPLFQSQMGSLHEFIDMVSASWSHEPTMQVLTCIVF